MGHDGGADHLAAFAIRYREHDIFLHARISIEQVFHFSGVNVEPARDNHVVAPAEMVIVAVRAAFADVAGIKPAVANPLGGGVGPAKITFHHVRTAGDDLAGLIDVQLIACLVDDLDFDIWHSPADAAHFRFGMVRLY